MSNDVLYGIGGAVIFALLTILVMDIAKQNSEKEPEPPTKIVYQDRVNEVKIIEYEDHEYLLGIAYADDGITIEHSASCKSEEHHEKP